jgi:glycerol-3-phosphate dehydrogenase
MRRARREDLTDTVFDIIVIGGGITGAATARDAALRGLSVLLVEKDDFAAGTSSRSSKLIHGGLRYLQTRQFRLVAESLRERERMLAIAPHLTEVRPFLYLLYREAPERKLLLNLGLTFYDAASGEWRKRRHRMLSARQVLQREPHLAQEGLRGAGLYYDVLTDDARLTIDTAKGAADAGAWMLNHAAVVGLVIDNGQACGVTIADQLDGQVFDVRGQQVVNATGPWTDRTCRLESERQGVRTLRPTKGVHIVVRKSDFPLNTAVFLRSPDDNRLVWPIPSLEADVVYIGTTDTDYAGDPDEVQPDESDVRYLINAANRAIPSAQLTERHVVGAWAGLRPLVASAPETSASNVSREHTVGVGPLGMLTISGGKLTASRVMAKDVVDIAVKALHRPVGRHSAGKTPISGGDMSVREQLHDHAAAAGVPDVVAAAWARRYGSNAVRILAQWQACPRARQIIGPRQLSRAEVRYCIEEEMCATLADLLVRRTAIFFWDPSGGLEHVDAIADELATALDWTEERKQKEIKSYRMLVTAHRPSEWRPRPGPPDQR